MNTYIVQSKEVIVVMGKYKDNMKSVSLETYKDVKHQKDIREFRHAQEVVNGVSVKLMSIVVMI